MSPPPPPPFPSRHDVAVPKVNIEDLRKQAMARAGMVERDISSSGAGGARGDKPMYSAEVEIND